MEKKEKASVRNILSHGAFFMVNKKICLELGLDEALLLADLVSKEEYFYEKRDNQGYFFNTQENIEKDTGLTPFKQGNALKSLISYGFVKTKLKGLPQKKYYKVVDSKIINFLISSNEDSINSDLKKILDNNKEEKELKKKNTSKTTEVKVDNIHINFKELYSKYPGTKEDMLEVYQEFCSKYENSIELFEELLNSLDYQIKARDKADNKYFVPKWQTLRNWLLKEGWKKEFGWYSKNKHKNFKKGRLQD